jgi:hypothetical protein
LNATLETDELIEPAREIGFLTQAILPPKAPSPGTTSTKIAH